MSTGAEGMVRTGVMEVTAHTVVTVTRTTTGRVPAEG